VRRRRWRAAFTPQGPLGEIRELGQYLVGEAANLSRALGFSGQSVR